MTFFLIINKTSNILLNDLRNYTNNMGRDMKNEVNLKNITNDIKGATEQEVIASLVAEKKIEDPNKLTSEERRLVDREVVNRFGGRAKLKAVILEKVKVVAKDFFDKKQAALEELQKRKNDLEKQLEIEKETTQKRIEELNNKAKEHESDDKKPALTADEEKELVELEKKYKFLTERCKERLSRIGNRIALARKKIEVQKEELNTECQERFGGWAVFNNNKKEEKQNDGKEKQDKGEQRQGEQEQQKEQEQQQQQQQQGAQGTQTQGAPMQGIPVQGIPIQGGGQRVTQGQGFSPVGTFQQQNGNSRDENGNEEPQNDDVELSDEEFLNTLLKTDDKLLSYIGGELSTEKALELIGEYSALSEGDKKKCISSGEFEVIEMATEKLMNSKITNQEKNILRENIKKIAEDNKNIATKLAKERKDIERTGRLDGRYSLTALLPRSLSEEEFAEIRKYFNNDRTWAEGLKGIKKPLVIYEYDNLSDEGKALLEKAMLNFKNNQIELAKNIKKMKIDMLNETNPEKKKKLNEDILRLTENLNSSYSGFEKGFASIVRTGKALAYANEIEEKINDIEVGTREGVDERDSHDSFEEELKDKSYTDEEIFEKRVERTYNMEKAEFIKHLQEKINADEEITFEEFARYNQYYTRDGIDGLPELDIKKVKELSSKKTTLDAVNEKYSRLRKMDNIKDLPKSELLTCEEWHLLVGAKAVSADSKDIEKCCSDEAIAEYKNTYDLKYIAKQEVVNEEMKKPKEERHIPDSEYYLD